jgi:hypothetical protein
MTNTTMTTPRGYAVHLFRFSQSLGWQKYSTGTGNSNSTTTIRVIPHRFYLAMPDIRTRLWLVDQKQHNQQRQQREKSQQHHHHEDGGGGAITTATIVRRGDRVKIATIGSPAHIILVFANIEEAVDFCDQVVAAVGSITTSTTMNDPRRHRRLLDAAEREEEHESGVEVLSYAATLLTDPSFIEFAQNLENALVTTDDGRALLEQFTHQLSSCCSSRPLLYRHRHGE